MIFLLSVMVGNELIASFRGYGIFLYCIKKDVVVLDVNRNCITSLYPEADWRSKPQRWFKLHVCNWLI